VKPATMSLAFSMHSTIRRAQPRIRGPRITAREVRRRLTAAPATNKARRFRIIRKHWVARANSVLSKIAHSEHVVVVVRR
jgi:hypothetical protein